MEKAASSLIIRNRRVSMQNQGPWMLHRSHGQTIINDLPEKIGAFFRHSHSLLRGTCSHFKRAQKLTGVFCTKLAQVS
jgi:hypothetical protein